MQEVFNQAKTLINASSHILLTMHEGMDGDDGGSILAMIKQLKKMGKKVTCVIKHGVPTNLKFLPGSEKILPDITDNKPFDLLIIFGCANLARTGLEYIQKLNIPTINIDHHPDNQIFGTVNIVDPNKSSVAELVYDIFKFNRWTIDKQIATCLLTGIITDTGSFMHSNTQSTTLKTAGELLKKGALTEKIVQKIYKSKSLETLKAWGHALSNLSYDVNKKIIYSIITESDLKHLDKLSKSAFEGLAEILNTFPEAKFAMLLRQEGNVIKGSLRTDPFKNTNVSEIAKLFGGGGHKMAAGFSIAGKLIKNPAGNWQVV